MPTLDAHGRSIDDVEDLLLDAMRSSDLAALDAVILWNGDRIEAALTYSRCWRIIAGRWQVVTGAAVPS